MSESRSRNLNATPVPHGPTSCDEVLIKVHLKLWEYAEELWWKQNKEQNRNNCFSAVSSAPLISLTQKFLQLKDLWTSVKNSNNRRSPWFVFCLPLLLKGTRYLNTQSLFRFRDVDCSWLRLSGRRKEGHLLDKDRLCLLDQRTSLAGFRQKHYCHK